MQISAEQLTNLNRLAPEIILCATGILIMVLDPFVGPARQRTLGYFALFMLRCAIVTMSNSSLRSRRS